MLFNLILSIYPVFLMAMPVNMILVMYVILCILSYDFNKLTMLYIHVHISISISMTNKSGLTFFLSIKYLSVCLSVKPTLIQPVVSADNSVSVHQINRFWYCFHVIIILVGMNKKCIIEHNRSPIPTGAYNVALTLNWIDVIGVDSTLKQRCVPSMIHLNISCIHSYIHFIHSATVLQHWIIDDSTRHTIENPWFDVASTWCSVNGSFRIHLFHDFYQFTFDQELFYIKFLIISITKPIVQLINESQ